jgi:predicted unusual protein kinase regulating ubiquinone biosynthesis (AarF/ABC1/UbiB family)
MLCSGIFFLPIRYLGFFARHPLIRWQKLARDYRCIAVEMGGVLIKLGQFLSIRVDILPSEVTLQLAGLQDKVPAAPTDAIIKQIETDFCRPLSEIFADFADEPLGSCIPGSSASGCASLRRFCGR